MNPQHAWLLCRPLLANEVRLRMRRWASLFAVFALMALAWAMVTDFQTGSALLVINEARVRYTSSAMAMGSVALVSPLFALLAFFLTRGRMTEDLRSGIGGVIASTPISNWLFLCTRWLGGVAYLLCLMLTYMCSMMLYQFLRGEGPTEPWIFLQSYLIILLPTILFACSCATLFDSVSALTGKAGDVLYFFLWVGQIALISQIEHAHKTGLPFALVLDFSGIASCVASFQQFTSTSEVSIGSSTYDPALAAITLPQMLWSNQLIGMRFLSGLVAILLLLPSAWLFHRYSPDKIKPAASKHRRNPMQMLNQWLRPLARSMQAVFALATRLPGLAGQVLAEIALSLVISPSAIAAIGVLNLLALILPLTALSGLLKFATVFWGILICDIASRDFQANGEALSGICAGGSQQRYVRQIITSIGLGLLLTAIILYRLAFAKPLLALALLTGITGMAALANLLGRSTRTPRTFLSLFLFTLYLAVNIRDLPWLDMVGFNGVANGHSIAMYAVLAIAATGIGWLYNAKQSR